MPIQTFWMLHKNIDRILAERDMRSLVTASAAQSSEGFKEYIEELQKQMKRPIVYRDDRGPTEAPELDREGLNALKGLGSLMS